jgi:DNA-binding LacI/PurR family transcriptional regulator
MRVLTECGLRAPEDVAVVGFDDIEESRYGAVTLTTVSPDRQAIARPAVDRLAGKPLSEPQRIRPGYRLIVRESTGEDGTDQQETGPPAPAHDRPDP